jgi:hypothetical protein
LGFITTMPWRTIFLGLSIWFGAAAILAVIVGRFIAAAGRAARPADNLERMPQHRPAPVLKGSPP